MKIFKSLFRSAVMTVCLATFFCTSCTQKEEPLPPVQEKEKQEQEQEQSDSSIQFSVKINRVDDSDYFKCAVTLECDRRDESWTLEARMWKDESFGKVSSTIVKKGKLFQKSDTIIFDMLSAFPKGKTEVEVWLTDSGNKNAVRRVIVEN